MYSKERLRSIVMITIASLAVGGFSYITGFYLLGFPNQWVDAPGGPYDLIMTGTVQNVVEGNCHGVYGWSFQNCWNYNVTLGHSLVKAANSKWNPTTETVDFRSVEVTTSCGSHIANQTVIVMVTVKDGHLILPNTTQAVQAVDPPQFMTSAYNAEGCP